MALFSRRNRSSDGDTIRLASAANSWWMGASPGDDGEPTEAPQPAAAEPVADADVVEVRWADDQPDGGTGSDGVAAGIAEALEEYGYGSAGRPLPGPSPVEPGPVDEASLFAHDGLPTEDHLPELLGALGLEGDADWVDIARAHRRLTAAAGGRADGDDQCQARAANEAYACLRLFHH